MGGTEFFGPNELLPVDVDGDDLARADHARSLNGIEAHAAATEDGYAGARRNLGPVEDGPGAGEHAAAHEAGEVEGRVFPNRNDALLREHGMRRVSCDLEKVVKRLSLRAKARGAVEHEPARLVPERAHGGLAADAVPASPARRDIARADVVAGLHRFHARPDFLDHPRRLVSQDDGQGMRVVARHHVQITMAHAVGDPAHLDLVRAGLEQLHVFHHQGLLHLVEHGRVRLHGCLQERRADARWRPRRAR